MHIVALALAAGFLSLQPAHADEVPGIGMGHGIFFSLDSSPVRIEFKSGPFTIPRKYVVSVLADGYSSRNGPLPDVIEADHIKVAFVEESGEAWTTVLWEQSRRMGMPVTHVPAMAMRPLLYTVNLHSINNPNRRTYLQASIAGGVRQADRYDGMLHYKNGSDVYVGGPTDSFEQIECSYKTHALSYCTYTIEITDRISAHASFLDFRHHGGRSYANRRARFLRDVVCRFAEGCQPQIAGNGAGSIPFIADQKRRICIKREGPQKDVVLGLTRAIQSSLPNVRKNAAWIDRVESLAWRLRVPETAWKETNEAWPPRPGVSRTFNHHLLYPEMAPSGAIHEELLDAWATVPRTRQPASACSVYADISFEEWAARQLFMEITAPMQYPEVAAPASVLDCDRMQPPRSCTLRFHPDGWRVVLRFRAQYESEAVAIAEKVKAYLDGVTLSRDPVPVVASPTSSN